MGIERPIKFESKETPHKASIPLYCSEKPESPISFSVIAEVQKASLTTHRLLTHTTKPYEQGIRFVDLVNITRTNETSKPKFVRKPDTNSQVLAIVLSTFPLFHQGREMIAFYRSDGIAMINMGKLSEHFDTNSTPIPQELAASIITIEETIHHIQTEFFHQPFADTIDTTDNLDAHLAHPAEKQAAKFKKQVLKHLYPNLDIQIKGVDY